MWTWVKHNKLSTLLLIVLAIIGIRSLVVSLQRSRSYPIASIKMMGEAPPIPAIGGGLDAGVSNVASSFVPQASLGRKIISSSNLSLLVKNVVASVKQVISIAESQGGYMVDTSISNPQDVPTGTVSVRVPSKNMQSVLDAYQELAVKVVTEEISGYDITDQYTDIEKRIAILEKTKAKFEEILLQAKEISDITQLNREIINIQSEIDSYKGQQEYLAKNADFAKITVYLSTDELALPYAPSDAFRPSVVFKLAIRSLVSTLRLLGTLLIWIAVYSIIWIPVVLLVLFIRKKILQRRAS